MVNHPRRSRKTAAAVAIAQPAHDHDADYEVLRNAIVNTFQSVTAGGASLFCTDAGDLFDDFLDNLSDERNVHTCTACRRFVNSFGSLVAILPTGAIKSAMWDSTEVPMFYMPAVARLSLKVVRARVTAPFLSSEPRYGTPKTGAWTHMAVTPPKSMVFKHPLLSAAQKMAEKREDFRTVAIALADFTPVMLKEAMRLLEADALNRSEKFIGPVQWLQALHEKRASVRDSRRRDNFLWAAIATAPTGYCHPRASVVGSLLEDIAAGMSFNDVKARFDAKMHPLRYQRPQAAPKAGAIAQAEKAFEAMGLAPALERRFARLDECETLWRPVAPRAPQSTGGVFAHLQPKTGGALTALTLPAQTMTWEKFSRLALPEAETMEVMVPQHGNFIALTSAVHDDAPRLFKWDNPVAWYVYHGGSPASQWGVSAGWRPVSGIVPGPNLWGDKPQPHLSEGLVLVLPGCVDSRTNSGNALFPECMREEVHGVRSVIEAYSRTATMGGREEASACGLHLGKQRIGYTLRVTSRGNVATYTIDRWD